MIGAGKVAAPRAEDPPPTVFANALLVLARHRYRKQPALASLAQESERVLREVFPPSFVHRLLGLMTEIASLQNTADTASLAQRMVTLIKEEAEQPQASPQPQEDAEEDSGTGDRQDQGNPQADDPSAGTDSSKGDHQSDGADTDENTGESQKAKDGQDQGEQQSDGASTGAAGTESLEPGGRSQAEPAAGALCGRE